MYVFVIVLLLLPSYTGVRMRESSKKAVPLDFIRDGRYFPLEKRSVSHSG